MLANHRYTIVAS